MDCVDCFRFVSRLKLCIGWYHYLFNSLVWLPGADRAAKESSNDSMHDEPTLPLGASPAERAVAPENATWGSFTLLARVGFGGFGEVYRAWDPHLQREVALKLLLPGVVSGEAEYESMLREARALASVHHANIVPVHGIDRHDGRVGFWTDFVHGKTLSTLLREQGILGCREAAMIALDVTRALSAVHRAGIVHRDIKAENVMREEGGRILLMDFGLSTLQQHQAEIAGTPNYMAPEIFAGSQGTVSTDIYAVGVLLYFLIAGDYPVKLGGMNTMQALAALRSRKPLTDVRSDVPEMMLRILAKAMELDTSKRYTSAGQLADALAESLGTQSSQVTASDLSFEKKRGKRSALFAAVAVVVALAIGLVGLARRLAATVASRR